MSGAEIQLLQQISASLGALNRRMEKQEEVSTKTVDALARLEERSVNTAKLEDRIVRVEEMLTERLNNHSERIRTVETSVKGAGLAAGWAAKAWPIVTGLFGGLAAYFGLKQ